MTPTDPSTDPFEALRPRLFGIAYRMTGSVRDAEDVCQEAWLRWNGVDPAHVTTSEAYLVRIVTNLAIDRSRAAALKRETYVGPYLPEPLVNRDTNDTNDPADAAELADSLTFAFLVLLDELTPVERAVLLLHDVFAYSFDEIAAAVDRSPEACRQLASRTRRKLERESVELRRPNMAHEHRVIEQLVASVAAGDVEGVMALLAPDVVHLSDGGRDRHAARNPVIGPNRVARLIVNLSQRAFGSGAAYDVRTVRVNSNLGLLITRDGHADIVMACAFTPDGRIARIYLQLNPDKLEHLGSE